MLALLRVAAGGCPPPIPSVARQGERMVRSGQESRPADRTGKRRWRGGVSLRIESDDGDRRPVAGCPAPAPWVTRPRLLIKRVARREHELVLTGMTLGRTGVADAAVSMLVVVPVHESARPVSRRLEVGKPLGRELGPVFGGAEQRLGERIVVPHPRSRMALNNAEPVLPGE